MRSIFRKNGGLSAVFGVKLDSSSGGDAGNSSAGQKNDTGENTDKKSNWQLTMVKVVTAYKS